MNNYLGDLEELVLIAVQVLDSEGYGVSISNKLNRAGRNISISATQATLARLELKSYLSSKLGEPTAKPGGRRKKFYQITGAGRQALKKAEAVRAAIKINSPVNSNR